MKRNEELEASIVAKYTVVSPVLDERSRRRWAAAESMSIGYGGDALVSSATGLARETIRNGRREIAQGEAPTDRIRRPGAGRPRLEQDQPGLLTALEALVDPLTRGDPTSPLRWTCKSRAKLAAALAQQGWRVGSTTVGRMLHQLGYRLQSVRKRQEGASHPDRNAQFEYINATADALLAAGQPVISVDTKKKEMVGNFKNGGREWQPKGTPPAVWVHDFPSDAEGNAIPYGVYDMARNEAWVSVGRDHGFLVLELVEGDTLADRLKRGPIPVEETLKLALQLAEALEAAHQKGVIHRDLKPANIKVTPEGNVKVLDFGLAKTFVKDGVEVDPSESPTIGMTATEQGVILGTAVYMSPEQARGRLVDTCLYGWFSTPLYVV